jgi:alkanesulfonate monooxygenase SsuD/methylene tetrahydromethanopterin reductase-like flavin-dependent oxidoreductase (luciferase family)
MDRFEEAAQILRDLLSRTRTTFSGQFFELRDAPNQPGPVQARLPWLVGGGGERRTMRVAARYADHWNSWTTSEVLTRKVSVLREHCERAGRDPDEIQVSTQARLYRSNDQQWLKDKRQARPGPPVIAGTPGEVAEIVASIRMPAPTSSSSPTSPSALWNARNTCDLFTREVASAFG